MYIKKEKYEWREATITDVCEWLQAKTKAGDIGPYDIEFPTSQYEMNGPVTGIMLDDASVVVAESRGHYATCDSDCSGLDSPRFWIGVFIRSKKAVVS